MPPEPISLGVRDAAHRLGISPVTIRRLIRRGELPAFRVGARVLIAHADLRAYAATRPAVRPTVPPTAPAGKGEISE